MFDLHTTFRNPNNFMKRGTTFIYPLEAIKCFNSSKIERTKKQVIFQKQNSLVRWLGYSLCPSRN